MPRVTCETTYCLAMCRAAAPILASQEVTVNYLGRAALAPAAARQAELWGVYGFTCRCSRCRCVGWRCRCSRCRGDTHMQSASLHTHAVHATHARTRTCTHVHARLHVRAHARTHATRLEQGLALELSDTLEQVRAAHQTCLRVPPLPACMCRACTTVRRMLGQHMRVRTHHAHAPAPT